MLNSRLLALLLIAVMAVPLTSASADQMDITFQSDSEVRGDLGAATTPAAAVARVGDLLELGSSQFEFNHHRTSLIGQHDRGVQVVDGIPVDGTWVAVHTIDGRVHSVQASSSSAKGVPTKAPIGVRVAESRALAALGISTAIEVSTDRVLVPTADNLVDTYRVHIIAPGVATSIDLDARSGDVIGVSDDRRFADAVATLFDPNPIATSGHIDMRQDVDFAGVDVDYTTDSRVAAQKVDLPITGYNLFLGAAGNLSGPHVNVIGGGPYVSVLGRFDVVKTDPRFEGLMAYHHIDAIQRYFQDDLGLDNINNESQLTVALPVMGFDNSFYQPGNDLVLFGAGGVDDGEDAEVIIHELGHAIHDDQVPGWGKSFEGGAMGEGFGDFLAGTYYATFEGTKRSQDTCLMEWDSTSYASGPQTCIRRMDTNKTYAFISTTSSVHAGGEVWSKYMWNVRNHLGSTEDQKSNNVLRLLLTGHFLVSPNAKFGDVIDAMLTVASDVGPNKVVTDIRTAEQWVKVLVDEAKAMGMPYSATHPALALLN